MIYLAENADEIRVTVDDSDDLDTLDTLATGLEFEGIAYERSPMRDVLVIGTFLNADLSDILELCETLYIDVEVLG